MNLYKSAEKDTIEALHRLNVQPVEPHWDDLVLSVINNPRLDFRLGAWTSCFQRIVGFQ